MEANTETWSPAAEPRVSHHTHHHHRHRKGSDPFLKLNDEAIKLSDQPSPSKDDENSSSHSESLFADVRSLCSFTSLRLANGLF